MAQTVSLTTSVSLPVPFAVCRALGWLNEATPRSIHCHSTSQAVVTLIDSVRCSKRGFCCLSVTIFRSKVALRDSPPV